MPNEAAMFLPDFIEVVMKNLKQVGDQRPIGTK